MLRPQPLRPRRNRRHRHSGGGGDAGVEAVLSHAELAPPSRRQPAGHRAARARPTAISWIGRSGRGRGLPCRGGGRPWWSPRAATPPRTRPGWSKSTTEPSPRSADCRGALAPGAAVAHRHLDDNLLAEYDIGYGDVEAAFRRRRAPCAGLAAAAQGARARHRMPRRRRDPRPARRPPDALAVLPGAAWRAPRSGRDARARRAPDRRPRRRPRRRVRAQARRLPRGYRDRARRAPAAPSGEVDRGPARALHRHHPGARPVLGDGGGDRRGRPPPRRPRGR